MAWRRPGDKPLSEPMMVRLPTHICVTRPQWVNNKALWTHMSCAFIANKKCHGSKQNKPTFGSDDGLAPNMIIYHVNQCLPRCLTIYGVTQSYSVVNTHWLNDAFLFRTFVRFGVNNGLVPNRRETITHINNKTNGYKLILILHHHN